MMRLAVALFSVARFVAPIAAEAQSKMYRIGNLVGARQTTPEIQIAEIVYGA
jgi:hypothetical protein